MAVGGAQRARRWRVEALLFSLVLRELPAGRRLWTASFDHRQHELTYRPGVALQLPGGGTRWLNVEELARFGVERTLTSRFEPR